MIKNNFNYFYSNTLLGWNKIQMLIYNLEEWQIDYLMSVMNNYGNLCNKYLSILKKNILTNPISIKRYKEYFKYKNFIFSILSEYEELLNNKMKELQDQNAPISPERVVIKGFKRYDD